MLLIQEEESVSQLTTECILRVHNWRQWPVGSPFSKCHVRVRSDWWGSRPRVVHLDETSAAIQSHHALGPDHAIAAKLKIGLCLPSCKGVVS